MLVANGYFDGDNFKTFEPILVQKNQKIVLTLLDEFINNQSPKKSAFGSLKDKITFIADDFDAPLDCFKEYE